MNDKCALFLALSRRHGCFMGETLQEGVQNFQPRQWTNMERALPCEFIEALRGGGGGEPGLPPSQCF